MNKNIIILDWDDTLFPTTWVNMNKFKLQKNNIDIFKNLDNLLLTLFNNLNKLGDIIIITNAMIIWINTCLKVLPKTKVVLKKFNIKIKSAREEYRNQTPDPTQWKIESFKKNINKKYTNIISVGDSLSEYKALVDLYKKNDKKDKLYKTIKFINNCRTCNNIIIKDQVDILNKNIKMIINKNQNLDLIFRLKN
jgi:hypothetical protein